MAQKKTFLSYSTINNLYESPHSWINKQLGIEQPTSEAMAAGKVAHKILQDHVTGVKLDPRIPLELSFKQAEYNCFAPYNDKFSLYGFIDCISFNSKTFMEYKTSSSPWSQQKFDKLMQIPFYGLCTNFRKAFMVTSTKDLTGFKTFYKVITEDEINNVKKWIDGAIYIIEKGDFFTDLDENKKCKGCNWGQSCYFL
jgi:CRISPR/Cas system-associated exonuclease Cas4 (RecB family)